MNPLVRGRMAAALSCLCAGLALAACGGGSAPSEQSTNLPASVTVTGNSDVEAGAPTNLASSLATTTGITFSWNFGDGSATAASSTASHAYADAGDYVVTLRVANSAGDSRTATLAVKARHASNVDHLSCTQADFAGWCWQDTRTTAHKVTHWYFLDKDQGWGVGADGTILHTTDGGTSWQVQASGTTDRLTDVRFSDSTHGFATTSSLGVALQTTDGGASWTRNALGNLLPGTQGIDSLLRYDSDAIVISHQGYDANPSLTISSHDGGATWTQVPWAPTLIAGQDCWATVSAFIVRDAGCGASSASVDHAPLGASHPVIQLGSMGSATSGLFMGINPNTGTTLAWSTADAGATWSTFVPTGVPALGKVSLVMLDDRRGWIRGTPTIDLFSDGTTSTTHTADGGHTWTQVLPPVDLRASGPTSGIVSGILRDTGRAWFAAGNRLASTLDGGATWQEASVPGEEPGSSAQPVDMTVVSWPNADDIVVSFDGRLHATHDGGATWTQAVGPHPRDASASGTALWFTDSARGVMALDDGAVKTTSDGGRTWSRHVVATTTGMPVALHFNDAGDGWLLMGGTLSRSTDLGVTWTLLSTAPPMTGLAGMSWADARHAWAWSPTAIVATVDGGATWQASAKPAGGAAIASLAFSTPTTGVLLDANGGLLRSVDGGATWAAIAGPGIAGRLVHTRGHVLWAVADRVARSTDDGATWTVVDAPAGGGFNDIAFADDRHGWMSSYAGVIASTSDGGATWSASNVGGDIRVSSVFASDAFTAWAGTSIGAVLATATGTD